MEIVVQVCEEDVVLKFKFKTSGVISSFFQKIRRYRKLKSSNYGRDFGWYIEHDGIVVGELVDPDWVDMFWHSYIVVSIDSELDKILLDIDLWKKIDFKFRNKEFDEYAEYAFPAIDYKKIVIGERISMRALYLIK